MTNQSPRGGTELQFEYLIKHVDPKLLDQVQICTSVPETVPDLISSLLSSSEDDEKSKSIQLV